MKKSDYVKLLILGGLIIVSYIPTFVWMYGRWSAKATYYSHGFLIPLISLFIVWTKRNVLAKLKISPLNLGWLIFLSGISVHAISLLFKITFTSGFSLIIVLFGATLLLLGKDYLRHLAFPISFLAFMVPLPEVAITNISFRLKIFATQVSVFTVRQLGMPAIRKGSDIFTRHARLMVEDPCSGIRSLVALIALGALMAYFSNLSKTKKAILFLASIPIAVSTNVIRIVSLVLVSEIYGEKNAMGLFHDTMGIVVFILAFTGLVVVGKILE